MEFNQRIWQYDIHFFAYMDRRSATGKRKKNLKWKIYKRARMNERL